MRPPEEVKRELVRQWLAKAEEDLSVSRPLLEMRTAFYATIGFHCQQAAEKYFKAFLTWHQREFPKTHDLALLISLIGPVDAFLAASLSYVTALTPYGKEIRYPGDLLEITLEDAEEAVQLAEKVNSTILQVLTENI